MWLNTITYDNTISRTSYPTVKMNDSNYNPSIVDDADIEFLVHLQKYYILYIVVGLSTIISLLCSIRCTFKTHPPTDKANKELANEVECLPVKDIENAEPSAPPSSSTSHNGAIKKA
jgi:hypothetical protein